MTVPRGGRSIYMARTRPSNGVSKGQHLSHVTSIIINAAYIETMPIPRNKRGDTNPRRYTPIIDYTLITTLYTSCSTRHQNASMYFALLVSKPSYTWNTLLLSARAWGSDKRAFSTLGTLQNASSFSVPSSQTPRFPSAGSTV